METNKRNYDVYLDKMEKAMEDKLFFLNHIDINEYDYIIDFGCADGTLVSKLGINPNKIILVDKDLKMLELASQKVGTDNLYVDVLKIPIYKIDNKKVLLILSSVLHEMDYEEKKRLYDFIRSAIDTVVVRDMIHPEGLIQHEEVSEEAINKIIADSNPQVVYKWCSHKGTIDTIVKASEYLLKMDYIENYDLEIKERYFSGNPNNLNVYLVKFGPFKIVYEKDFTIPPMIEKQKKYGLPNFRTHRKVILMRKELMEEK